MMCEDRTLLHLYSPPRTPVSEKDRLPRPGLRAQGVDSRFPTLIPPRYGRFCPGNEPALKSRSPAARRVVAKLSVVGGQHDPHEEA